MKLPSPAMFVSVAALVVAMGGSSYAAIQVNGKDIKAKSITSSKIKKDTLGSGVIKDGTIKAADLAKGVTGNRWVYVGRSGQIEAQSGGFTLVAAYPTLPNAAPAGQPDNSQRAAGNVYINAGADLGNNAMVATIALQNTIDQNGDGVTSGRAGTGAGTGGANVADVNPEFSGEITVSRCNAAGQPGPTNCAPTGAQNLSSFVVSPRLSDGSVTTDANRKAFYVVFAN